MTPFALSLGAVAVVVAVAGIAVLPGLAGAQSSTTLASHLPGKVHLLPATLETTQWGWFDNAQAPVLSVEVSPASLAITMSTASGRASRWAARAPSLVTIATSSSSSR